MCLSTFENNDSLSAVCFLGMFLFCGRFIWAVIRSRQKFVQRDILVFRENMNITEMFLFLKVSGWLTAFSKRKDYIKRSTGN